MVTVLLVALLVIMAASLYYLITNFQWKPKRRTLMSQIIGTKQQGHSKLKHFWLKQRWTNYMNPSYLISEARKYGWDIKPIRFWSSFALGSAVGIILFKIYFSNVFLSLLGVSGGFLLINFEIHHRKKKYKEDIEEKLGLYLRSLATTMATFRNAYDAIKNVLPDLESPINKDVDSALLRLQQGSSIKDAFSDFQKKYNYSEVRLFHDILDVIDEAGGEDGERLRRIANKFKKKKTYRRKVQTVTNSFRKNLRTLSIFTLSLPFLFMLQSFDNFLVFSNSLAGKIVMFLSLLLVLVGYVQLEKQSVYDPTEDNKLKM